MLGAASLNAAEHSEEQVCPMFFQRLRKALRSRRPPVGLKTADHAYVALYAVATPNKRVLAGQCVALVPLVSTAKMLSAAAAAGGSDASRSGGDDGGGDDDDDDDNDDDDDDDDDAGTWCMEMYS